MPGVAGCDGGDGRQRWSLLGWPLAPLGLLVLALVRQHAQSGVQGALLSLVPFVLYLALRWAADRAGWRRFSRLRSSSLLICLGLLPYLLVYPGPRSPWPALAAALVAGEATVGTVRGGAVARVPASMVELGLGVVFFGAFLLAPYWALGVLSSGVNAGPPQLLLALTIAGGLAWARLGSGTVRVRLDRRAGAELLAVGLVAGVIHARPLSAVVPLGSDEAYHLSSASAAALTAGALVLDRCWVLWALVVSTLWARQRAAWPPLLLLAALFVGATVDLVRVTGHDFLEILRYPQFARWLSVPFLLAWDWHTGQGAGSAPLAVQRLLPLLCAAGVAWCCLRALAREPLWLRTGFALGVLVTPLLVYYGSYLWLEMPVVFLLTFACLDAQALVLRPARALVRRPAWYALLLAGFVRETAIAVLLAFVLCRVVASWATRRPGASLLRVARQELVVGGLVLGPTLFYAWFRTHSSSVRNAYEPVAAQLLDPATWGALAASLVEQMAPLAGLGLCGAWVAWHGGRRAAAAMWVMAFGGHVLFHALDSFHAWFAYSRFNLFLIPPLLAGSVELLRALSPGRRPVAALLLAATLAYGVAAWPLHPDGTRRAGWGRGRWPHTVDDSWPHDRVLLWLLAERPGSRVAVIGRSATLYGWDLAFQQLGWRPPGFSVHELERADLSALQRAERAVAGQAEVVVVQVPLDPEEVLAVMPAYRIAARIRNDAREILVLERPR